MTSIEYSKFNNEFLLTDVRSKAIGEAEISFVGEKDGKLYINGNVYTVNCGKALISKKDIPDGDYIPILKTDTASFICDKITVEAGVIKPFVSIEERLRYLTKQLIYEHLRATEAEDKISRLSDAVYAKTIL